MESGEEINLNIESGGKSGGDGFIDRKLIRVHIKRPSSLAEPMTRI